MQGDATWRLRMAAATRKTRPTLVATTATTSTGNGTSSITLTVPAGTQNGDLLIGVAGMNYNSTGVYTQASFTEVGTISNTNVSMGVYYRIASSEPASYSFVTGSGSGRLGGGMLTYRGAAWDVTGTAALSETANGITVSEASSILLGLWVVGNSGSQSFSTPSGMSATGATFTGGGNPNWVVFSQDVDAGATGTKTSTSGSGGDASVLFSIKPA